MTMARNKDIFEGKLGKMLSKRIQECEAKFEEAKKIIAENQAKCILNENYGRNDELLEALKNCEYDARTCNAAADLCKYIFYNEDCNSLKECVSIATIECDRWNYAYDKFREKIEDIFCKNNINTEKGFVYIFWSLNPTKYFYVGKTYVGLDRFKEDRHSSLVRSSEEATKLTIIFPYPRPDIKSSISYVEASIIRIIGIDSLIHNKAEHIYNKKINEEKSPIESTSELSERLSELKNFLGLS